ncbi:MAG TPA: molybdopterin molybdotransferase MoeA [bacterium]|nr:molybdopterin molybdotransferase MoeA [bacterium]
MKNLKPKQALEKVLQGVRPLGEEKIHLTLGLGRKLVGSLFAPYDYPLRDVSAMDGFAFRFQDWKAGKTLRVTGERMAGDPAGSRLVKNQAIRIMTGAPVPPGADTVIPKEKIWLEGDRLHLLEKPLREDNIRFRAEGIRKGRRIDLTGESLSSRALGFLASLGVARVTVAKQPRVAVLVTGEELVAPGDKPGKNGVFESNGLMLQAALRERGLSCTVEWVGDRPKSLSLKAEAALRANDILLVTGGVSVGDRDPTRVALARAGVKQIFWRVAQKPGGPLYFGRKGNKAVFGLPGNPAAVYSCFLLYVLPLLRKLQGLPFPKPLAARLQRAYKPLGRKTHFVKARLSQGMVKVLGGQGSHLLEMMALGDGLLEVPPGKKALRKGTTLRFYRFPEVQK